MGREKWTMWKETLSPESLLEPQCGRLQWRASNKAASWRLGLWVTALTWVHLASLIWEQSSREAQINLSFVLPLLLGVPWAWMLGVIYCKAQDTWDHHLHTDHGKDLPKISGRGSCQGCRGKQAQRKDSLLYRILDQRETRHTEDKEEMPKSWDDIAM